MKEALAEVGDFKVRGRIINKVRSADDTAIIAKTQEELKIYGVKDWLTLGGILHIYARIYIYIWVRIKSWQLFDIN